MMNASRDSLSDLASSEDKEDGEDEDDHEEDTGHGKLGEDDEPGWVISTNSKTVQHHVESFLQKQMMLDELTQTDVTAAIPSPTTFGELIQALHFLLGQSQMPQVASCQGSSGKRLGSEKPHPDNHIVQPMSAPVPDSSQIQIAK
jgi:hypothetical protein